MANSSTESRRGNRLLRILGVERKESPLVFPLLLHNFFLGMGIAFLFTTSSAIFLHEFEGPTLALAFVAAGLLMMAIARIYAYFEHKLSLEKYLPMVVLALPAIVLVVRMLGYAIDHAVAAFAMLAAYRIVYMLANLEFWGFTSLVFDIRQSKRLFGLIGSGDIPAKMLGYLAVTLLSKLYAPEDLLYVSVVAFLAGYLMLRLVLRNPTALAQLHKHSHQHHHDSHGHSKPKGSFLKRFFGGKFIVALAGFALLSSMAMAFVDYSFYGKVKHQYHSSHELAAFLGLFNTVAMTVTFALKLLFSGKLLQRLGVSPILVFLPILLLLSSAFLLLPLDLTSDQKLLLWAFSLMYLVRDVCKYALVDPMFLALFQPLQSHLRLRGHTIVKGLMDPMGILLAGAAIYLGEKVEAEVIFKLLAAGLVLICILWILAARNVGKEWLKMLRQSVRKRFIDGKSVSMGGKATADLLLSKLENESPTDAIYALRMLEENQAVDYDSILLNALSHRHPEVQYFALQKQSARQVQVPTNVLELLTSSASHPDLLTLASKMLLQSELGNTKFGAYASHEDEALKRGAIAGMLLSADPGARAKGEHHLEALLISENEDDQAIALWLIGETQQSSKMNAVRRFMDSDANAIVELAIHTAGRLGHPDLVAPLLKLTQVPKHRAAAMGALATFEETQITAQSEGKRAILRTLCRLAGKPDSRISLQFLLQQLGTNDAVLRREAIHALLKRDFKAPKDRSLQALIADLQVQLHSEMAQYQSFLVAEGGKPLAAALEIELHDLVDQLLICFSFIYDSRTVMRARHGLQFKSTELRAGALEILDHLLPRGQAARLLGLLEVLYLHRTNPQPQKANANALNDGCKKLMAEATAVHDAWTICLATDHYLKSQPHPSRELITTATNGSTPFLAKYNHWLQLQHPTIFDPEDMHAPQDQESAFSPLEMVLMLKSSTIFSGTPENTLAEVAAIAIVERVSEGTVLFKKGDTGDCMYIIAEGEIQIGDGPTIFATLKKNDFFGELALVETEPRSADAIAASDCLLLRIDQDDFYELIEDRTEVARSILVILAQRLRRQNEIIRNLKEKEGKG